MEREGQAVGVMACTVVDGRIVEILSVTDPERLAAMDLPGRPNETSLHQKTPRLRTPSTSI